MYIISLGHICIVTHPMMGIQTWHNMATVYEFLQKWIDCHPPTGQVAAMFKIIIPFILAQFIHGS